MVHNIILNLLKRRYELHTVHEKKDKVCCSSVETNGSSHRFLLQNWKETLIDDLKLVYPSSIVPVTIRSLVEKQLVQMKSADPHAVLATLMNNNNGQGMHDVSTDGQQLRLDLWDMPGSTTLSDITHQVRPME